MKISRIIAAGAGALLVGASVFAGAGAASAADFYLTDADLTATETSPYSAGWFRGNVSGTPGTYVSTPGGLAIADGQVQVLNGTPGTADILAADPQILVSEGAASFQIPVFTGPGNTAYTTLYADSDGIESDLWYTSSPFGGYLAGETATLGEFVGAMDPDYTLLAFGFNVTAAAPATVAALAWNGDIYWFLPTPAASLSASTITTSASATTGTTLTASGFLPGEEVDVFFSTGQSGGSLSIETADVNGVVTYAFVADPALEVGTYTLGAIGFDTGVFAAAELTVVADAAVVVPVAPAPTLPATGAETTVALASASVLLLAGAAFMVFATRRRAAAQI